MSLVPFMPQARTTGAAVCLVVALLTLAGCDRDATAEGTARASSSSDAAASPTPTTDAQAAADAAAADAEPAFVVYANCDAVRAAGAAPIRVGEPGYSTKLDRDRDGIGCES